MEGDIGRFVVCNKIFFAQKAGGGRRNNYVAQVDFNLAGKSIQDREIFALEFKPATELLVKSRNTQLCLDKMNEIRLLIVQKRWKFSEESEVF